MEALKGTESAANAITRVKYTHDAMIDLVIAHPELSQNKIAEYFGFTVPWVSRIFCSDAFQARLAERRTEIVNPALTMSIEGRIASLATQSLDILEEKLAQTRNPDMAMRALDISVKALGYGARQQNVAVQQNFVVALPSKALSEDAWALAHRGGLGAGSNVTIIEAEPVGVK